ncbi:uncharacterized protein BP5553_06650 [Venustampulla echinocandica]|uniref:Cellobiose dehydrogenase cytochrome domain-containing protein n=1 Tax=Venustampulla echinocandica TaxID=2656787 RepID=A0A370TKI9_9HELO|nr:uncharacterized protein BP5553_06650 [Venustampulla echinocandica]RDL36038.1 hypothetical protein BP5553_06650 [Venustampulla echinocandica]
MHLPLPSLPIVSLILLLLQPAAANRYLYMTNCTGNPQNGPWIGMAFYNLPAPPINMEKPYDINILAIGADRAAAFKWEGRGDGAIMGSWRLSFHIDQDADKLERGEIAGGGTKVGDAGRQGLPFDCYKDDERRLYQTGNETYCLSDYWCEVGDV